MSEDNILLTQLRRIQADPIGTIEDVLAANPYPKAAVERLGDLFPESGAVFFIGIPNYRSLHLEISRGTSIYIAPIGATVVTFILECQNGVEQLDIDGRSIFVCEGQYSSIRIIIKNSGLIASCTVNMIGNAAQNEKVLPLTSIPIDEVRVALSSHAIPTSLTSAIELP